LIDRFIDHPDVTAIDIGHAPDRGEETQALVLRIHVREQWTRAAPGTRADFPEQVAGIPVVVMVGEYHLDAGAPAAGDKADRPGRDPRTAQ
jgi:hypothetical protein